MYDIQLQTTKKALLYACRAYLPKWDLYTSRQSPVDILGAYTTDFNPLTPTLEGRIEVDGSTSGLFDLSTLTTLSQTFDINSSNNYISYIPDASNINWEVIYNNAVYVIEEGRLKKSIRAHI